MYFYRYPSAFLRDVVQCIFTGIHQPSFVMLYSIKNILHPLSTMCSSRLLCGIEGQNSQKLLCTFKKSHGITMTLAASCSSWSKTVGKVSKNNYPENRKKSVHKDDRVRLSEGDQKYELPTYYKSDHPKDYGYNPTMHTGGTKFCTVVNKLTMILLFERIRYWCQICVFLSWL